MSCLQQTANQPLPAADFPAVLGGTTVGLVAGMTLGPTGLGFDAFGASDAAAGDFLFVVFLSATPRVNALKMLT